MATIDFQTLNNGDHSAFDPDADVLSFLLATLSAADVSLVQNGANLEVTADGKTITLDATTVAQLTESNVTFAGSSILRLGDGTSGTLADWYGQYIDFTGGTVTNSLAGGTNNQVRGLGGADTVRTGTGDDLLVGNVAFTPLEQVSQIAGVGAVTGTSSPSISADGRLVAFAGGATLFGSENNNGTDVFVKDVIADTVSNEHRSSAGLFGNSGSGSPVISADGSSLVFISHSSNLVDGPASGTLYDIFKSDVASGDIVRVNTTSDGTLATDGRALTPDVSSDGRYVTFVSDSENLATEYDNHYDVFVKDTVTGELIRISQTTSGIDGNGDSTDPHISADGNFIVFQSEASNLTPDDNNGYADIFLWSRADGSLTNLTASLAGTNLFNSATNPDIGGTIVFETGRSLVAADTHNSTDIYAFRIDGGEGVQLVSATANGTGVGVSSGDASVSGDGRFVVFTGFSDSLVPGDTNGYADVFVKDLVTGAIALVSHAEDGTQANQASGHAEISLGGDWIVFQSSASNLGSPDVNGVPDVFRVANPLLLDTLAGGAGNDSYVLDRPDLIQEALNAGTDTVGVSFTGYVLPANVENLVLLGADDLNGSGNSLNNVIAGNAGNNTLNGGTGTDAASYEFAAAPVTVSLAVLANVAQDTGDGMDVLNGFENLIGSNFDDFLTGSSGANALDGGTGADQMTGGNGADTYYVDNAGDSVSETNATAATGGIDLVMSGLDSFTLPLNVENGRILLDGDASLTGNTLANVLFAGPGNNVLNGSGGIDTASYEFATAPVSVSLAKATAQATGGSGSDTLSGIENLAGSKFNDVLVGSAGNNLLRGLAGKDTLTGGKGKDVFLFDTAPNSTTNLDKITDFSVMDDTLQLENSIFTKLTKPGVLATANFYASTTGTAHDANDYLCYNTRTGVLSYDKDGTGGIAPLKIATLFSTATAHPVLTFADFLVV